MRASELALSRGLRDTHETIALWRREDWRVLGDWFPLSLTIAVGLLVSVWGVATLSPPDLTFLALPGITQAPDLADVGGILFRNSLVLALHAFACIAGFIAGSSLPLQAERYSGTWRLIHDRAGPLAIAFVVGATAFSLMTQAFILGSKASTIAFQLGLPVGLFLVTISLHALPELVALFLPLAAWVIASRRGDWHELLAATFVTVGIAAPILVVSAFVETYLTPELVTALIEPTHP